MKSSEDADAAQESALVAELIGTGSDLVGAVAGAAIGLVGGPVGALGGAAAGVGVARAVRHIGAEVKQRVLSPREEARVGGTLALITVSIDTSLRAGAMPRSDWFSGEETSGRPAAEEVLEGVLLKARDAYEEKKVPLLANLYATIAFHEEVSRAHANHLLELAARLTYRQLVVLTVALDESKRELLRTTDYRGDTDALERLGIDGRGLITEIYDLYQQGLVADRRGEAWISVADVAPSAVRVQGSGAVLAFAMKLAEAVPSDDRGEIYALLGTNA